MSFTENTVHLSFSHGMSITIESSFAHSTHGDFLDAKRTSVPARESRLMQLLGESIESAQATADGTLRLNFSKHQTLECYDDTPQYEAYRLRLGEEEIIV